jgi:5-methylcytosine-specific restriction enzyme A
VADERRASRAGRGYDAAWYAVGGVREQALIRDWFTCQIRTHCRGEIGLATEVDHIIPVRERPELRLVLSNLQSACKACHSAKTMREIVSR